MNINYLNHSFKVIDDEFVWTDIKCEICDVFVVYFKNASIYEIIGQFGDYKKLNLTCEEVIIKKLLE